MSKNMSKMSRQYSGKVIARLKFMTVHQYKYQMYINSYYHHMGSGSFSHIRYDMSIDDKFPIEIRDLKDLYNIHYYALSNKGTAKL